MSSKHLNGGGAALHDDIQQMLNDGRHIQLLRSSGATVKKVDFASAIVRELWNTCPYEIMWHTGIPSGAADVVCLFPNHEQRNSVRKQVLYAKRFWWLSSLNKEINRRLKASVTHDEAGGTTRLAVCYGRHVFICDGLQGNAYLLWARYINRANHGNVPNTLFYDVPVLVNTNGLCVITGLYILRDHVKDDADLVRVPLTQDSPKFLMPKDVDLFVCEVRKTRAHDSAVETNANPLALHDRGYALLTRKQALARVLARTPELHRQQQNLTNPDGVSADFEHSAFVDMSLIQSSN